MSSASKAPLPVTILTGFLGAGKTTLLHRILSGVPVGHRVAIEATGVVHSGLLAHVFLAEPALKRAFYLDGVVASADAENFEAHEGIGSHATEQVAYADAIIINKRDRVRASQPDWAKINRGLAKCLVAEGKI